MVMKKFIFCLFLIVLLPWVSFTNPLESDVLPFIEETCIDCHDEETETRLDFTKTSLDLSDKRSFHTWVSIFDKIESGEMPPRKKRRADFQKKQKAMAFLGKELSAHNIEAQKLMGRTPLRRLNRTEFQYTLNDILGTSENLQAQLPLESESNFDTISSIQDVSPAHISQYLQAIESAVDALFRRLENPKPRIFTVDYPNSNYMKVWYNRKWFDGGDNTRGIDNAVVGFKRTDFIWRTDRNGFKAPMSGKYRLKVIAQAYQARSPVTFLIYKAYGSNQDTPIFIKAFDIKPNEPRPIDVFFDLNKDDYLIPAFSNLKPQANGRSLFQVGAKNYTGEGIALGAMKISGPHKISNNYDIKFNEILNLGNKDQSYEIAKSLINQIVPIAWRRSVEKGELEPYYESVYKNLKSGLDLKEVVTSFLKAIFTSPSFLYLNESPGPLNNHQLATRLSYFLWKSLPDSHLLQLGASNELSDPKTLREQTNRLIDDPKFNRFIESFSHQWLLLKDIDATNPDKILYPEFNDRLKAAMVSECELFLKELFRSNLSTLNLIDSNFTYLNKELASHYKIKNVNGHGMRKVILDKDSLRGGLLGKSAIHKVTANGTTTSPVRRGNFILTKLFGTPSPPPPANVGSIEPDIRGVSTIRELLEMHRKSPDCQSCHSKIDPPGFALECFDPIGGFRERYRKLKPQPASMKNRFIKGLRVDTAGKTFDEIGFKNLRGYKKILLQREKKDPVVTRNVVSQLVTFATGSKIQFADRQVVNDIVTSAVENNLGMREIIHQIIQSSLFRNK